VTTRGGPDRTFGHREGACKISAIDSSFRRSTPLEPSFFVGVHLVFRPAPCSNHTSTNGSPLFLPVTKTPDQAATSLRGFRPTAHDSGPARPVLRRSPFGVISSARGSTRFPVKRKTRGSQNRPSRARRKEPRSPRTDFRPRGRTLTLQSATRSFPPACSDQTRPHPPLSSGIARPLAPRPSVDPVHRAKDTTNADPPRVGHPLPSGSRSVGRGQHVSRSRTPVCQPNKPLWGTAASPAKIPTRRLHGHPGRRLDLQRQPHLRPAWSSAPHRPHLRLPRPKAPEPRRWDCYNRQGNTTNSEPDLGVPPGRFQPPFLCGPGQREAHMHRERMQHERPVGLPRALFNRQLSRSRTTQRTPPRKEAHVGRFTLDPLGLHPM